MSMQATHPLCERCIAAFPGTSGVRVPGRAETCCYCGRHALGVVYIRAEISAMPHCTMPQAAS